MGPSALPLTLWSVTSTKIQELKKQRDQYEASKKQIIRDVKPCTNDMERTLKLLEGSCRQAAIPLVQDTVAGHEPRSIGSSDLAKSRRIQQLFLRQAKSDPAFGPELVAQIHDNLVDDLNLKSAQHEHAQFFSELVTDWLSSSANPNPDQGIDLEESSFESVGRKEMHEQRAQWEALVFSKAEVDNPAITTYLHEMFETSTTSRKAFAELRAATTKFCGTLSRTTELLSTGDLEITIKGLLKTDLLSDENVATLKSFQNHAAVLQEVVDVLNMRFITLDTWKWTTVNGAIPVEQRRQLNGKYRVFMDEDILDALLLHTIGMKWAIHFRSCLIHFFESPAWTTPGGSMSAADTQRRRWFLGTESIATSTVETERRSMYKEDYFMSQLPATESEGTRGYDSDEESGEPRKNPIETKQSLLHLLITEALVDRHLRPDIAHAVVRSDFQWFGPSLPHGTIFAALKFFGVDAAWLNFFQQFLQAPTRFVQDGPQGQFHVRQRGVPMSHALSDVFGEVILFVMDFAVNKKTHNYLYRLHDDFWFWGSEALCSQGWEAMTTFASIMGITFNEEKTGSVVFQTDCPTPLNTSTLPEVMSVGAFCMVNDHIQELQRQLSHCTSVFPYIQAYNAYLARFFINHFGKPSYAFGREHIDDMIDTLVHIQNALFSDGRITGHLIQMASDKFGVKDIPDGVWYWPVHMGGLELRNALIPLYCMRETLQLSPQTILSRCLDAEESAYLEAKNRFEKDIRLYGRRSSLSASGPSFGESFMSMEEYMQHREECSTNLHDSYNQLLDIPDEFEMYETDGIAAWLEKLPRSKSTSGGIHRSFQRMKPYWRWILAMYGSEIVEKYGSVQIVDATRVPLGVVGILKAGKVRWQG